MNGYCYGEHAPTENCPYCGTPCDADFVDIGVGYQQCGPFHCDQCGASEIGPNDEERELTDAERQSGWYAPNSEPGSSANVIGGKFVSHQVMRKAYRDEFKGNPLHDVPGCVEDWFSKVRKQGL
ncbi:MAG TPA: hypothetical protein VMJ73_12200 [Rhizomicrobium sp.]|nr:hypothetical protein [Rhizomicrobium sp.]